MGEHLTWREAKAHMIKYNRDHGITSKGMDGPICTMCVVITEDSFNRAYDLEARTYMFNNYNKGFIPSNISTSIFADSLDGSDRGIRLDGYLLEEGTGNWKVDYCYIKSED